MTTTPRLFLDTDLAPGATLALDKEDSHYLVSVMRRGEGDQVRVFNGRDGEWLTEIAKADRKRACLCLVEQTRSQISVPDIHLLFAPVKRQKTDLIVEKAVELGAAVIQPVYTQRTQTDRIKLERFTAIAKEAAEQTERLDLPRIRPAERLSAILDGWDDSRVLIFCDEAGEETGRPWGGETGRADPAQSVMAKLSGRPAAILIGPEGGFTTEERQRLRELDYVCPIALGPRILRAETAVIAALTLWQSACGDW